MVLCDRHSSGNPHLHDSLVFHHKFVELFSEGTLQIASLFGVSRDCSKAWLLKLNHEKQGTLIVVMQTEMG
jgi:hypothetical protein